MKAVRLDPNEIQYCATLEWDEDYRSVYVKSLENIIQFIQGREEIYYEDEVKKIVKDLKGYVTN
jgi:hypothetical protein